MARAAFAVVAVAPVAVAWSVLDRGPAWTPLAPTGAGATAACVTDGRWRREAGELIDITTTTLLASNAGLTWCAPDAGVLSMTLRGTLARAVGARAVVAQGSERLLDVELRDQTETYEVTVPGSGLVLLAFVNDFYEPPEDRNLWISGLSFTARSR
jgi:hypothetical protein